MTSSEVHENDDLPEPRGGSPASSAQPSPPSTRRATAPAFAAAAGEAVKKGIFGALGAIPRPFRRDARESVSEQVEARPRPGTSASMASDHSHEDSPSTTKRTQEDQVSLGGSSRTGNDRVRTKTPADAVSATASSDHAMDKGSRSSPTLPTNVESQEGKQNRRRRHGLLNLYYGLGAPPKKATKSDPLDIDADGFAPEQYMAKTVNDSRFEQVITLENDISAQMKSLDSEVQTLVYENYNKFIGATDTVRKMKSQVDSMTDTMKSLAGELLLVINSSYHFNSTFNLQIA
jgi:hypothetical protein